MAFIKKKKEGAGVLVAEGEREGRRRMGSNQYHLGLAYASAGDATLATKSLSQALALKPDFDGAQEAKALLGSLRSR